MAIEFAIHDSTGKILRTGSCPAHGLKLQAKEGEHLIQTDGTVRFGSHKVVEGVAVSIDS